MAKRRQSVEIYAPTAGVRYDVPRNIMPVRNQPEGKNAKLYYGVNQKEYGTSIYATGVGSVLGAPINLLYEARFPNASALEVFTHTGVFKYSSGADTFVSDGQVFSGTYEDFWSALIYNDQFFYTQGINNIQIKSSISATGTDWVSAVSPDTYKAWAIGAHHEHLNLYHTIENGAEFGKRVRWTVKGVLPATTAFSAGLAGGIDLPDVEGDIRTAVPIGNDYAIYGDRSIHVQSWVGGEEVYRFEKQMAGVGTPSRRGVASYQDVNWVFSHENIYEYYGGSDLRPIGDPVKRRIFSTINQSALGQVWVEYDDREQEVLFHIPTGSSTRPDTVWVYRIPDKSWISLERPYTSTGRFSRRTGLTWGELVGNWGAQNYKFGDATIRAESSVKLYGDQSGHIVKVDPTAYSLCISGTTTAQTYVYETPDLTATKSVDPLDKQPMEHITFDKRWIQFSLELFGNGSANVFYSTDRGVNFNVLPESPLAATPAGTLCSIDIDERCSSIALRVTNTATNEWIGIGYVKAEFIPGSEQERK